MDGFNINKLLFNLQQSTEWLRKVKNNNKTQNFAPQLGQMSANINTNTNRPTMNIQTPASILQNLQMNHIGQTENSLFIRNLLGLPNSLSQLFVKLQNLNHPLPQTSQTIQNLNQNLIQEQNNIMALFDDTIPETLSPEQILNLTTQVQKAKIANNSLNTVLAGMINIADISNIITINSKQALASLIIAMASASKNGINSDSLRETLSVINSCISMVESDNPNQTIKSLMLLYLPWLPLNEGVGFELEITPPDGENDSNNSKLTVLVQTKNFGNVKGEFVLTTSNSVDIFITCAEGFPKNLLLKSLTESGNTHSMNTNIDIEEVIPKNNETKQENEAKVNLSATNEMNPYLLLMAHSFIRETITIDNNA